MLRSLIRITTTAAALSAATLAYGQSMHGHAHGADGTGHDMINMPGLQGQNATVQESADLALMFQRFHTMRRQVTHLPNGIRTITKSSDPEVMEALVNHSVGMIDRVGQLDDPKIVIQSPTLDIFFARGDRIKTEIDITEEGLIVVQTTDDPALVAALQTHADEVTAMVEQGMHAVHQMMMKRANQ